jgi:hypothetical protein
VGLVLPPHPCTFSSRSNPKLERRWGCWCRRHLMLRNRCWRSRRSSPCSLGWGHELRDSHHPLTRSGSYSMKEPCVQGVCLCLELVRAWRRSYMFDKK